jgi:hypothetical protein
MYIENYVVDPVSLVELEAFSDTLAFIMYRNIQKLKIIILKVNFLVPSVI